MKNSAGKGARYALRSSRLRCLQTAASLCSAQERLLLQQHSARPLPLTSSRRFMHRMSLLTPTPRLLSSASSQVASNGLTSPAAGGHHAKSISEKDLVQEVSHHLDDLCAALPELLLDRRSRYMDNIVTDSLLPLRAAVTESLYSLVSSSAPTGVSVSAETNDIKSRLNELKDAYMRIINRGVKSDSVHALLNFYAAFLASDMITCEGDVRAVLEEMRQADCIEPTANVYRAILTSLLVVPLDTAVPTSTTGSHSVKSPADSSEETPSVAEANPNTSERDEESILGQTRSLRRGAACDRAGYYFGAALATQARHDELQQRRRINRTSAPTPDDDFVFVDGELWASYFSLCALGEMAPRLMDLWWEKFLSFYDAPTEHVVPSSSSDDSNDESDAADLLGSMLGSGSVEEISESSETRPAGGATATAALPVQAVYAALAWAAQQGDIERALKVYHTANQRGVTVVPLIDDNSSSGDVSSSSDTSVIRSSKAFTPLSGKLQQRVTLPPSALTSPLRADAHSTLGISGAQLQSLQLRMLAKLMLTVKNVLFDGGLKALVTRDLQRLISPEILLNAPWSVINDLISGLSIRSATQLLKLKSSRRQRQEQNAQRDRRATSNDDESLPKPADDRLIPFPSWASLLRRCAHEHYVEEAEALFLFIRKTFKLSSSQKRELVEIMMRMYVSFAPPDFDGAVQIFTAHVLQHPADEPAVPADKTLYNILIKGADSRNAAMMVFLESCAAGVGMDLETFEGLTRSNKSATLRALTKKLPSDYPASKLDEQLRIPSDVDAHLRREEALTARGKPLYDSTGDY